MAIITSLCICLTFLQCKIRKLNFHFFPVAKTHLLETHFSKRLIQNHNLPVQTYLSDFSKPLQYSHTLKTEQYDDSFTNHN